MNSRGSITSNIKITEWRRKVNWEYWSGSQEFDANPVVIKVSVLKSFIS